jgi:hypothetical protein
MSHRIRGLSSAPAATPNRATRATTNATLRVLRFIRTSSDLHNLSFFVGLSSVRILKVDVSLVCQTSQSGLELPFRHY